MTKNLKWVTIRDHAHFRDSLLSIGWDLLFINLHTKLVVGVNRNDIMYGQPQDTITFSCRILSHALDVFHQLQRYERQHNTWVVWGDGARITQGHR